MSTVTAKTLEDVLRMDPAEIIITNAPLSLDVGATLWLLRRLGETRYPGIATAKHHFLEEYPDALNGYTPEEWLKDDKVLFVGCGGGSLDHHPHGKFPGECTFTQTLKELGISRNDEHFKFIVEIVSWDDLRHFQRQDSKVKGALPSDHEMVWAPGHEFKKMQRGVKRVGDFLPLLHARIDRALRNLSERLDCNYDSQVEFLDECPRIYEDALKKVVRDKHDREWRIIAAQTDSDLFTPFARSSKAKGGRNHVLIRQMSTGQVQIQTFMNHYRAQEGMRFDMTKPVRQIRAAELMFRELPVPKNYSELDGEGALTLLPWWHYQSQASKDGTPMMLNGSHRFPHIEPTRIPMDWMVDHIFVPWLAGNPVRFET